MAKAQSGCLGWIIVAGAAVAWLSGGFEDRKAVTSVPGASYSLPVSSSEMPPAALLEDTTSTPVQPATPAVTSPGASKPALPGATRATEQPGRPMSTTANVRLRASEAADAPILRTLKKGTPVEVSASSGDRLKVSVPSLGLTGWVHRDYVAEGTAAALVAPTQPAVPKAVSALKAAKPTPPKQRSEPAPGSPIRDPVYGSCDCPYDYARNGSRCGGRSAYSRPGGRSPVCYYE